LFLNFGRRGYFGMAAMFADRHLQSVKDAMPAAGNRGRAGGENRE
jgi:hypothetical protein